MAENKEVYPIAGTIRLKVKATSPAEAVRTAEEKVGKMFAASAKRMEAEFEFRVVTDAAAPRTEGAAQGKQEGAWSRLWATLTRPIGTRAV